MKRRIKIFTLGILLTSFAPAQDSISILQNRALQSSNVQDLKEVLLETLSLLRTQEEELNILRNRFGQASKPTDVAAVENEVEIQRDEIDDLQEKLDWQLEIHGYFNTDFVNYGFSNQGLPDSFNQEHTSLFLLANRGRFTFFSELEWAHSGTSSGQERAWVEYRQTEAFKWRAGESLIPTYWNLNHYPTLTKSINKPLINQRFMPFVYIGTGLSGQWISSGRSFSYSLYGGNGIDSRDLAFQGNLSGAGRDKNNRKALGQKLKISLDPWNLLELSFHHYEDSRDFHFDGIPIVGGGDYEVYMTELQGKRNRLGLIASYARSELEETLRGATRASGWYFQPFYALDPKLSLYYRAEKIDMDQRVDSTLDQHLQLVGLNRHFGSHAGVKLEYVTSEFDNAQLGRERSLWTSFYFGF